MAQVEVSNTNAYRQTWDRDRTASLRDVARYGAAIKDTQRRARCAGDLRAWIETYCPEAVPCEFGDAHLQLLETTQQVVLEGGNFIACLPRASGKTTLFQRACLWAALNSHSPFIVLATADDGSFTNLLDGIKKTLECSDEIHDDYPEITSCVRALEGVSQRAQYQLWEGTPTKIEWKSHRVVFPTTSKSLERGNAGVTIRGGGITGALRGMVSTTPEGKQIRPSLVFVDDPQTRKSAKSPSQVAERLDIMNGDLLKLGGVGTKISALCAATVIYQDDLACRLLDNERSPDWQAMRVRMLGRFPDDMGAWDSYDNVRRAALLGDDIDPNEYYREHQEELDKGAEHYWPARIDSGKVSAIQSAMDVFLQDPRTFRSEYQNDPEEDTGGDLVPLVPSELAKRTMPYKRGVVPDEVAVLTAHIDCQLGLLFWAVVGFTAKFGSYVVDYGTYPKMRRRYFYYRELPNMLRKASPGNDDSGALRAGIEELVKQLSAREFKQGNGSISITKGLVDARYKPQDVEAGIMSAKVGGVWQPAYGVGVTAKNPNLLTRYTSRQGSRRGNHWVLHRPAKRKLRSVFYDTNFWKSRIYDAWSLPKQHREAMVLWDAPIGEHQLFCDHQAAEVATRVEANGRTIDEWDLPTNLPDNHWWDNVVGCAASASVLGIRRAVDGLTNASSKRKRKYGVRKLKV